MRPGPDEVRDVDWALQIVSRLERDDRYQAWEAAHVLADAVRLVRSMCEVWIDREPHCAGVRAIRDELLDGTP